MRRLYYTDSYLRQVQAHVTVVREEGRSVSLDQTIFYPASGGQPHDLGTLNGIPVVDVIEVEDDIVHVLEAPLMDDSVRCEISWHRRYDHMQQHTGQHLLSAVCEELFQIPTLSFHMGAESSTVELGATEISRKQRDAVVYRATELARDGLRIGVTFEDANEVQGLRKASERTGVLRIVEIPGVDRSACGGTHVASLAEVLPLQFANLIRCAGTYELVLFVVTALSSALRAISVALRRLREC